MMLKLAKLGIAMAVLAVLIVPAAYAGVPDITQSFYVPQAGQGATLTEGAAAISNARRCPNHDGTNLLRFDARLKVVVKASDGTAIANIPAGDICVMFNGGTGTNFAGSQGFTGVGDDSIIATSQYNPLANCPDVRCVSADAPTNASGETFITWLGTTPGQPGVGTRDPFRKWGGWAGDIPVLVLGFKLQGRLTTASPLGSYTAHIKSLDTQGGNFATPLNQGERVDSADINPVKAAIGTPYKYLFDYDNDGSVQNSDLNIIKAHNNHRCNTPLVN